MVFADSAGDTPQAERAYRDLVDNQGVTVVITSASWISNAIYRQAVGDRVMQAVVASAAFDRSLNQDRAVPMPET